MVKQTSHIDVSVVLNLHREAPYLRATLLSLGACAVVAREAGLKCELIAVFDRPDAFTKHIFNETPLDGFIRSSTVEVDVGSLGLARNAGIAMACGEFIWTSDGDDLVSRNAIVELHNTATAHSGVACAVFMNYLVAFGEQYHVGKYYDSSYLTVADFAYQHPYVSRIFLRRQAFDNHHYRDLRVTSGYAYEDWDFDVRLRREGYQFLVAPDTVFFYRQRHGSLLQQANAASARIIPHSPFFDVKWFVEELDREQQLAADSQSFLAKRQGTILANYARELVSSPILRAELIEANKLDPEVELSRIKASHSYSAVPWHMDHWGFRLANALRIVGPGPFSDVVLLPWLNPGGGEKYILQILHQLAEAEPDSNFLVLCGESAQRHAWSDKLPRRSVLLDVYNAFPMLSDGDRDQLITRLLLSVTAPKARLHIKTSIFTHRLVDSYGSILLQHFAGVYYRFSNQRLVWQGVNIEAPYTVKFLRKHLPALSKVICDCDDIVQKDRMHIGMASERYHVIYVVTRAHCEKAKSDKPSKRLLWASRVSIEKKPELLPVIAKELRGLFPDLIIEIYGHADPGFDPARLFDHSGLRYAGPYDNFGSLPISKFDALLYTSAFDGMPNVILEAMAVGLPVIAPDVGGIRETVITGQTGYLVPDVADDAVLIAHYVGAIKKLYEQWEMTQAMSVSAYELIRDRNNTEVFAQRVADVFEIHTDAITGETSPILLESSP
jgi:glycosyltransferase involved in cell wall biosynthesis